MAVIDENTPYATRVSEILGHGRQMQNLIITGILAEVGSADGTITCRELHKWLGDFYAATNEGFEHRVVEGGRIEITHDDQIMVFHRFVFHARFDSIAQQLEFAGAGCFTVAPSGMQGDGQKVEIAGPERAQAWGPPKGLLGDPLFALLDAGCIDFCGQTIMCDGPSIK